MERIILNRQDIYILDNRFFTVKSGKILIKNILENGKIITNECCFSQGDIIGNFFSFLDTKDLMIPEVDLEIEALEDNTILEELEINREKELENTIIKKLLDSIIRKILLDFYSQLYDLKGYMLSILKMYVNSENHILKKNIKYENFNISKSHFYLTLSKLKEEKFVIDKGKYIALNMKKIDKYLEMSEE